MKPSVSGYVVTGILKNGKRIDLGFASDYLEPIGPSHLHLKINFLLNQPDGLIRVQKALRYFSKNYEKYNTESLSRIELIHKIYIYKGSHSKRKSFHNDFFLLKKKVITYVKL